MLITGALFKCIAVIFSDYYGEKKTLSKTVLYLFVYINQYIKYYMIHFDYSVFAVSRLIRCISFIRIFILTSMKIASMLLTFFLDREPLMFLFSSSSRATDV